jgi:hypothetical protein
LKALEKNFDDCYQIFWRPFHDSSLLVAVRIRNTPLIVRWDTSGLHSSRDLRDGRRTSSSARSSLRKVLKPLWLLAGPRKLPEADILHLIEEGWGSEPVHPSTSTNKWIASSILAVE